MAVSATAGNSQKVSPAVYDNIAFQPVYLVFPRESAVFPAPFLDLTTEASR